MNDNVMILAAEIEKLAPRPHHSRLLEMANKIRPGCTFRYALNRGGWYRPGGVVTADGTRIADNVESWVKAQGSDDVDEFVERYMDSGLLVTRHTGRTHYFVAAYGPAPADFLQLEVEELQEVLDRQLLDIENPPNDIQELIEPVLPALLDAQAVGVPYYRFRRLIDARQIIARTTPAYGNKDGLARLITEWSHSSAALHGHFSDHWLIALREHLDRYRNPVITAALVSCHERSLKPFQWNTELSGIEMSRQLQAFDRAAGFPAAWYFHLVAGTITPPSIAYAVVRDLDNKFNYLPDSEAALLKNWMNNPYSV
jgi:hypothetical protein